MSEGSGLLKLKRDRTREEPFLSFPGDKLCGREVAKQLAF